MNFSENKGKAPALLTMIDQARSDGCDITLDTYPYLPGCTTLASLLPSWASAGGPADTLGRLDDPSIREKIRYAIEVTGCDGGHGIPTNWEEIQVRLSFFRDEAELMIDRRDYGSFTCWYGWTADRRRRSFTRS
jgi:N-acyl-D-amino-acid deacylase